jgi:hypothetical protein
LLQEVAPASVEMTEVVEMAAEAPMPEAEAAGEKVMSEAGPPPDEEHAEEAVAEATAEATAVVPTLTPAETRVGALGLEPPPEKEGEAVAEAPRAPAAAKTSAEATVMAFAEATATMSAEATATMSAEATATMSAEATATMSAEADTAAGAAAPTQTVLPTLLSPEPPSGRGDTVVAEAREPVRTVAAEQESKAVGAVQQSPIGWLRLTELGLLISLLLLGTLTAVATIRRRRTR